MTARVTRMIVGTLLVPLGTFALTIAPPASADSPTQGTAAGRAKGKAVRGMVVRIKRPAHLCTTCGFDVEEPSNGELDDAFTRPIPQDAKPDMVDLNKNNVQKYDAKDFLPKEVNDKWF